MNSLKRLLSRSLPATLFHYTSQAGLLGILRDRAIWASKITFLNDTAELALALDLARKAVMAASPARKISNVLLNDLDLMSLGTINIFVCSFSRHKDQLSQWRGYTKPGDGYSIGFKVKPLQSITAASGFTLGPCSYSPSQHLSIVRDIVNTAIYSARTLSATASPGSLSPLSKIFRESLYFAAPFLKDRTYKEEAEWRLVSSPTLFPNVSYRAGRSHMVPYFQLQLTSSSVDPLPISDVIVGPTPNSQLALDAVESLFTSTGQLPCTFEKSAIPFRNW